MSFSHLLDLILVIRNIPELLIIRGKFLPPPIGGDRNLTNLVGNLTKGNETAKTAVLVITNTDI